MVAVWQIVPKQGERRKFGCITDLCRCSMGFNQFHRAGRVTRLVVRTGDCLDLATLGRGSDAFSSAIR